MIEGQAIGDAPAAIVPGDREAREAETLHDRHHVAREGALGVGRVVRRGGRAGAAAVAAQVGAHDGEAPRKARGHVAPHQVGLGEAV
jgi:hypothetical protein